MKLFAICALTICALVPVYAATNIGVSIGIRQPGAYGRIDVNNYPSPELVYQQPMIIRQEPMSMYQRPIYLYVPVAQQQNWQHYCGRYQACGQRVYFVQERWVRERFQQQHEQARQQTHVRPQRHDHGHEGKPGRQDKPGRGNSGHHNNH